MTEEMVDIVNENDEVIGTAPRKGIHKTGKLHRASHVFLLNKEGKIWLELRAMHCDSYPGYYSSSVAGHISSGEDYRTGAAREAEEELGIPNLELKFLHKFTPTSISMNEFVSLFTARSDQVPKPNEDTERFDLFTADEIYTMIKEGKRKASPMFMQMFEWYRKNVA